MRYSFFTIPLARYVGESGKVYALDTSPTMIKELRKKIKKFGQVKPIRSKENKFPLEDGILDFALLVNMIHELEHWRLFWKEVWKVLKLGGRICTATDTGFIAQNVYLYCASEGLATVVRASIDRPALAKVMKLRSEQKITLAQSIGYPKK